MFERHRHRLVERMTDAVAVFFAAPEQVRNNDVHFAYRQDSDFYFLSGFEEPEAVLVIAPQRPEGEQVAIFVRPRDPEREVWDGKRLGIDAAPEALGVDAAHDLAELAEKLPDYLVGARTLYFALGQHAEHDEAVMAALTRARRARREGRETPSAIVDPGEVLHPLRLIKDASALASMRKAAALTGLGHRRAMAITAPGVHEYQLQAAMEYEWSVRGARRQAYPSIVGSGPNACVLHYRDNSRRLEDGDLVLVDAGCEFGYHASDVTRTWPASGRFTDAQRAVYQAVLDAQKAAIAHCVPGNTFDSVHTVAVEVLTEHMVKLGLLEGPAADRVADEGYKRYYMHRTGHWLGMDVHDVGRYHVEGDSRPLEAGMVLTVEPGLYIAPDDEKAPEALRGIGVRIEDDVLVTADGPEVLTGDIPKEVADVEAQVGSAPLGLDEAASS